AAQAYVRDAHYGYMEWGALAKVKQLEELYLHLLARPATPSAALTTAYAAATPHGTDATAGTGSPNALDVLSVLKASQAISGEIVLETLLAKMMHLVIENAGAERGALLLPQGGHWGIAAEATIAHKAVTGLPAIAIAPHDGDGADDHTMPRLPMTIINYIAHTQEPVVLDDAVHRGEFTRDQYIVAQQPKSVLCTPLVNQGKLTGILYLENNLATGAFTPD